MIEKTTHLKPALSDAIYLAAQVFGRVCDQGQSLPVALRLICPASTENSLRGAVQDLAYLSMRQLAAADAIISKLMHRAPSLPLRYILTVALALLLDKVARYPEFTIVDQAVASANYLRLRGGTGVVNAVLRNFLRQRNALETLLGKTASTRWNFPVWWIEKIKLAYPADWKRLLDISNQEPPMTLRVNLAHTSVEQVLDELNAVNMPATRVGAAAIKLNKAVAVTQIPGFSQGLLSVQDAGAQLAVPLLDVHDGMRVLDACAAPGGKTGHLLETAAVKVQALELDAQRAQRITENLTRLAVKPGAEVRVLVGDALAPSTWWDGVCFDRILLDAPCSASGIVRRHPDIRWLRRAADLQNLVQLQRNILLTLWPLLAPGGKLLYVTCSIFPEEGAAQVAWFESRQADAVALQAPGQILPKLAEDGGTAWLDDHDGFYYALFEKRLN